LLPEIRGLFGRWTVRNLQTREAHRLINSQAVPHQSKTFPLAIQGFSDFTLKAETGKACEFQQQRICPSAVCNEHQASYCLESEARKYEKRAIRYLGGAPHNGSATFQSLLRRLRIQERAFKKDRSRNSGSNQ